MRVFTMYLSEDGLNGQCATNVRALHLLAVNSEYNPLTISYFDRDTATHKSIGFSYENLFIALKASTGSSAFYAFCTLECESGTEIRIQELGIYKG
jgi:hypothetical protein